MSSVSTAELAICAALALPVLYILFKHGRDGFLGWAYLFIFCTLRIVSGAMSLSDSSSASVVSNVGLSPLLLATAGILHETRIYRDIDLNHKVEWILVLLYHLVVVIGVAILAAGASALQKEAPTPKDFAMVKAGIAILTVAWVALVGWSTTTLVRPGRPGSATQRHAGFWLLWSVAVSLVFTGIRIIYTLVAFVTRDETLNPTTGSLAVRVVLSMIPELITLVIFIVAGLLTRHCRRDARAPDSPQRYDLENRGLKVNTPTSS